MKILHGRIIGVLVRDEEGTADLAAVRILTLPVEDLVVQIDVVDIHGAVERDRDHLRHLLRIDVTGDASAVSGTVAIGQDALFGIAIGSAIRIGLHGCNTGTFNNAFFKVRYFKKLISFYSIKINFSSPLT